MNSLYRLTTSRTQGWIAAPEIKGSGWLKGYKISKFTGKVTRREVKFKEKHVRTVQGRLCNDA